MFQWKSGMLKSLSRRFHVSAVETGKHIQTRHCEYTLHWEIMRHTMHAEYAMALGVMNFMTSSCALPASFNFPPAFVEKTEILPFRMYLAT